MSPGDLGTSFAAAGSTSTRGGCWVTVFGVPESSLQTVITWLAAHVDEPVTVDIADTYAHVQFSSPVLAAAAIDYNGSTNIVPGKHVAICWYKPLQNEHLSRSALPDAQALKKAQAARGVQLWNSTASSKSRAAPGGVCATVRSWVQNVFAF